MHGLEPEVFEYTGMLRTLLGIALAGTFLSLVGGFVWFIAPEMHRSTRFMRTVYGIVFGIAFIIAGIAFS